MDSIAYITSRKKQYDLKDLESRRTKLDIKDLPKNVSAFFNDKGYIDKTVSDLINYYKKSETYTKEEVQNLVSTRVLIKIVDKLPESNISTSTIYFLKRPKEDLPQSQYQSDVYDEYIYVDATWELIGNTYVDLTPYYTKEEVEVVINDKILEERLIRENAEFILQSNIDSLDQETNDEITQIKQINLNQDELISNLETNLENEITRAINSENELANKYVDYDSHVENKNNPHAVNKVQVGLSEIENLPIDDVPALNSPNYVRSSGVFEKLESKVDKIEGKGLSDENFTYAEKTKLSNLENYDDTEIANNVNANTSAISVLNSDSTVEGSVDNKIKNALLDVSGLQFNVVEELPTTGENGIIYFVLNTSVGEGKNYYDEYIWVNNKFELLGQTVTEIDLSNYHTKAEISALLSSKASTTQLSTAEANAKNLANATGTLAVDKGGTGKVTAKGAQNNLLSDMSVETSAPTDDSLFAMKYTTPSDTNGALYSRKASLIWDYIEGKISRKLGLTSTSYSGKASTAGTADTARALSTTYIKDLSISGKTITYTKGDDTTGTLTTQDTNTTYSAMTGASSSADGKSGLVPTPTKGNQGKYLRADGTWQTPTNTTYSVATQSANGLMSATDKTKLDDIESGANAYVHPTTSGNKHIPSGGATNQILKYSGNGTAEWSDRYNSVHMCSSEAGTKAKTIQIKGLAMQIGVCIKVCFTNGNSSANPTLSVSGTSPREIVASRADMLLNLSLDHGDRTRGSYFWKPNVVMELMYDGTYWVAINNPIVNSRIADSGKNGWKYYLDGYKEQWGIIEKGSNLADETHWNTSIMFTTKFSDKYSVQININATSSNNYNNAGAELSYYVDSTASMLYVQWYNRNSSTANQMPAISWNAKGY